MTIKIKIFCSVKDTKRLKRQVIENICKTHMG